MVGKQSGASWRRSPFLLLLFGVCPLGPFVALIFCPSFPDAYPVVIQLASSDDTLGGLPKPIGDLPCVGEPPLQLHFSKTCKGIELLISSIVINNIHRIRPAQFLQANHQKNPNPVSDILIIISNWHQVCMSRFIEETRLFVFSQWFWTYHGILLTLFWLVLSALGIHFKKKSTLTHIIIFAVVDYGTMVMGGAAFYRVFVNFDGFDRWSTMKLIHVAAGTFLMFFMMLQHILGIIAYHKSVPSRRHRKLGRILPQLGRFILIVGYLIKRHPIVVIMTASASLGLLLWDRRSEPSNTDIKTH